MPPATGGVGVGLTVTVTLPAALEQLFKVAVTKYVPDALVFAFGMVGFCNEELNPFGPVHE